MSNFYQLSLIQGEKQRLIPAESSKVFSTYVFKMEDVYGNY